MILYIIFIIIINNTKNLLFIYKSIIFLKIFLSKKMKFKSYIFSPNLKRLSNLLNMGVKNK